MRIVIQALLDQAISSFGVDEWLSWVHSRDMKPEEDKAYSLLGILNVYISPLYGEGIESVLHPL